MGYSKTIARGVVPLVVSSLISGIAAACVTVGADPSGSPLESPNPASASSLTPGDDMPLATLTIAPVDPAIAPVSRSDPGSEAREALEKCGVRDAKGLDAVAGMGLVPKARDAVKYTRLFGTEPEINVDAPAWVIQMSGRVDWGTEWANNPVCVVIAGEQYFFITEAYGEGSTITVPKRIAPDPEVSLPSLAP